jgi:sugar phosphate isomerase/epimerase
VPQENCGTFFKKGASDMTDRKNWMLGISQYRDLNEAFLERCAKNGVESVEYAYTENDSDYDKVEQWSKNTGVRIWSRHLDFIHLSIAHPDKERIIRTMETYRRFIHEAAMTGAKTVVVHPSSEPISDEERPLAIEHSKESLRILAERARKAGITIAVENLPRTCLGNTVEELMDIISVDDDIVICFDVNHLLKQTHKHFVSVAGSKIKTLHISDYDFIDERHLLPGEGKIDWNALIGAFEKIGYAGAFNYELTAPLADIKENYKNLFDTYNGSKE